MICRVTLKSPDSLDFAIEEMVEQNFEALQEKYNSEEFGEYDKEDFVDRFKEKAEKWFRYSELVTLEIDFENNTCEVIET